jgi:hypothetical protein
MNIKRIKGMLVAMLSATGLPTCAGVAVAEIPSETEIEAALNAAYEKVFTMATVIEESGPQSIAENIGVDATGQVFNSIVAVEQYRGFEMPWSMLGPSPQQAW